MIFGIEKQTWIDQRHEFFDRKRSAAPETTGFSARRGRQRRRKVPTRFRNRTENYRSTRTVGSSLTSTSRTSTASGTSSRALKNRNRRNFYHATSHLAARRKEDFERKLIVRLCQRCCQPTLHLFFVIVSGFGFESFPGKVQQLFRCLYFGRCFSNTDPKITFELLSFFVQSTKYRNSQNILNR